MKEEITNIRTQFRSLKMSLRELYAKNQLSLKITLDIKDFVKRVDDLSKKFEEELPASLREQSTNPKSGSNAETEKISIVLNSKRGTKIDDYHKCSQCHAIKKPIYRYSESNIGVAYLCGVCKDEVFDRSFGHIGPQGENLIGRTIKSGGGWETNRRKH